MSALWRPAVEGLKHLPLYPAGDGNDCILRMKSVVKGIQHDLH
jgi:hypothetical protein